MDDERHKKQTHNLKWDLSYVSVKARFVFEVNHGIVKYIYKQNTYSFHVYGLFPRINYVRS